LKKGDFSEVRTASMAMIITAVRTPETSVYFKETTRRYTPSSEEQCVSG